MSEYFISAAMEQAVDAFADVFAAYKADPECRVCPIGQDGEYRYTDVVTLGEVQRGGLVRQYVPAAEWLEAYEEAVYTESNQEEYETE